MTFIIGDSPLSIDDVYHLRNANQRISLSKEATAKVIGCREYLEHKLTKSESPIYGINTGFGSLCDTVIDNDDLGKLQHNLVVSHACGVGEPVPKDIVRIMMALKIKNLSLGHSGIREETLDLLIELYNNNVTPVVFEQGSLGASGDLCPLAHMSLPLLGLGEVWYENERKSSADVLSALGLRPLELAAKEGLALLNGTQFMQAYMVYVLGSAARFIEELIDVTAVSFDAFDASIAPLFEGIHRIRNHEGQQWAASQLLATLKGSSIAQQKKAYVQDPYSFRCSPQVYGASYDSIQYVRSVVTNEINAVTDNPLIFPEEDHIVSGGNFHGQPMALVAEQLAIALAEMASISERRTYKLMSGTRGLPAFLVANPGLNSGFMIPQYTAASLVSQNKQLCTPAAVDTIDSSNGQEDHVSMGANAVLKLKRVLDNAWTVLGIEWLSAAQALEFRRPLRSSERLEEKYAKLRETVPFVEEDMYLSPLILEATKMLKEE